MSELFTLPYCSECGEARVPHSLYKAQAIVEIWIDHIESLFEHFGEGLRPYVISHGYDRYARPVFETLTRLHLATFSDQFDPRDTIRTKALYDGARETGVELRQFRLFNMATNGVFVARKGDRELVFSIMPRPRTFNSPSLQWMDDKGKLKSFMIEHHIPSADGGVARTASEALAIFDRLGPPVITKPHRTSRGIHTVIGIRNREALIRAFNITIQVTPQVIVERELQGVVHRVTMIGGKLAGIVERDYPNVVGDGISNVVDLLRVENADPRRDDFAFFRIAANDRADAQLAHQGLTWESVPARGQKVILNDKVSRRHGTVTIDVTDTVHPDNLAIFEKLARDLGDPLIGVDFMIGDMSKSWKDQPGSGVIECNSMPYIDLHEYPYVGVSRHTGAILWNYIFPN